MSQQLVSPCERAVCCSGRIEDLKTPASIINQLTCHYLTSNENCILTAAAVSRCPGRLSLCRADCVITLYNYWNLCFFYYTSTSLCGKRAREKKRKCWKTSGRHALFLYPQWKIFRFLVWSSGFACVHSSWMEKTCAGLVLLAAAYNCFFVNVECVLKSLLYWCLCCTVKPHYYYSSHHPLIITYHTAS